MLLALDSETTGLDLHFTAKPYFVTLCDDEGGQEYWEWDVDPVTREPQIPKADLRTIYEQTIGPVGIANGGGRIVLQNARFDIRALSTVYPDFEDHWPWDRTEDTLLMAHLLYSNGQKDLTSLAFQYLGVNIEPVEDAMEAAVKQCRRYVQQARLKAGRGRLEKDDPELDLSKWHIAEKGDEDMPSVKASSWKQDAWLPRALCKWATRQDLAPIPPKTKRSKETPRWYAPYATKPKASCKHEWKDSVCIHCHGHHYWQVTEEYANVDSAVTVALFPEMHSLVVARDLVAHYEDKKRVMPILYQMETNGVPAKAGNLHHLRDEYRCKSRDLENECVRIAATYDDPFNENSDPKSGAGRFQLEMPKTGTNQSLNTLVFAVMELPIVKSSKKTGQPSLDKHVLDHYAKTLPEKSRPCRFIKNLIDKRSVDTAISYLDGYERFWLPLADHYKVEADKDYEDWMILYPSFNQTGTDTTRLSSSNPNTQNVSKQKKPNPRYIIGPPPGWEMYTCDYENLELRLPAYASGQQEMIDLFEKAEEPPYFGSQHLLVCHILHKEMFEECLRDGVSFKDRYKNSWYSWTKNGNFATQYRAGAATADRAYHVPGGQAKVAAKFWKIEALNDRLMKHAQRHGYIETMPRKTVNPKKGYPLFCARTDRGGILPTTPLSYYIQGTAGEAALAGMQRCQAQLEEWQGGKKSFDGRMIMNVHDELVFLFRKDTPERNKERILKLKELMEMSGDDIGIPLRVSASYYPNNWSEEQHV